MYNHDDLPEEERLDITNNILKILEAQYHWYYEQFSSIDTKAQQLLTWGSGILAISITLAKDTLQLTPIDTKSIFLLATLVLYILFCLLILLGVLRTRTVYTVLGIPDGSNTMEEIVQTYGRGKAFLSKKLIADYLGSSKVVNPTYTGAINELAKTVKQKSKWYNFSQYIFCVMITCLFIALITM